MSFKIADEKIERISVVGLGKFGASLAACLAHKGFQVMALDTDTHKINLLRKGLAPVLEPGLDELIRTNRSRLDVTQSYHNLVKSSQVTFVVVSTHQERNGALLMDAMNEAINSIAHEVKQKDDFHLIVVASTLPPGTMDRLIVPILENESWKIHGYGFGVCYCPCFGEMGNMIHSILNPNVVLIGSALEHVGIKVSEIYHQLSDRLSGIEIMNNINAELTKLALDNYRMLIGSYGNSLGELCTTFPGAQWNVIMNNVRNHALTSGDLSSIISHGGPYALHAQRMLQQCAKDMKKSFPLMESVEQTNHQNIIRLVKMVLSVVPSKGRVGILGLSYMQGTDNIENSHAITLVQWLIKQDVALTVFDPMAIPQTRDLFEDKISYAGSLSECIADVDIAVIATPWDEFKEPPLEVLSKRIKRLIVIDCWDLLDRKKYQDALEIIVPGNNSLPHIAAKMNFKYDYNLIDLLEISKISEN